MKITLRQFAWLVICTAIPYMSLAINEEYGVKRYYQPNGISFMGRHFGDEFGDYYQTSDGFLFGYRERDKYYHYRGIVFSLC